MCHHEVFNSHDPPKEWVVELEGHFEQVHDFLEYTHFTFESLLPETINHETDDENLVKVTVRMRWNSQALMNMLESMKPNEITMSKKLEETHVSEA